MKIDDDGTLVDQTSPRGELFFNIDADATNGRTDHLHFGDDARLVVIDWCLNNMTALFRSEDRMIAAMNLIQGNGGGWHHSFDGVNEYRPIFHTDHINQGTHLATTYLTFRLQKHAGSGWIGSYEGITTEGSTNYMGDAPGTWWALQGRLWIYASQLTLGTWSGEAGHVRLRAWAYG